MPKEKKTADKPRRKRKKKGAPEPRGLEAAKVAAGTVPAPVATLAQHVAADGGAVLATYRDPLGGHWQLLAALPVDRVEPTPYQRDLSPAHVARLAGAIDKLGRFLDPVIAVRTLEGKYWTPNGYHRLGALRELGARSLVAIVVPEQEVAHRILVLNTEKSHNLRERSLEVARLAQALAGLDDRPEKEFETEFEDAALITLGLCYQEDGRFSGGVYHPVLKRCDRFLASRLPKAIEERRVRAKQLLELNAAVNEAVAALKARGLESPYLKAFVVARVNPLRWKRGAKAEFEDTFEKMLAGVKKFDATRIRPDQVVRAGGPPEETA
ncbi:MAG TPA: ParB/RepB/Spo0J family partition protein [Gemmatimonadales bacterium]|nr:ParB/RepB/Spo0J family partition protein [Gemmatimonadales bacterium]